MKNPNFKNELASFRLRHRAECESDGYKGKWRSTPEEAATDANNHRAKHPNETHYIDIVTDQRFKLRLDG